MANMGNRAVTLPHEALPEIVADSISDVILVANPDGEVRYVSPSCTKLTGYSPVKLATTRTAEPAALKLIHTDDRGRMLHTFLHDLREGKKGTLAYRFMRQDGRYVWLESVIDIRFARLTPQTPKWWWFRATLRLAGAPSLPPGFRIRVPAR